MLYYEANRMIFQFLQNQDKAEKVLDELTIEYWKVKKAKLEKKYKDPRDLALSEFEIIRTPVYEIIQSIREMYMEIRKKADNIDFLIKIDRDIKK